MRLAHAECGQGAGFFFLDFFAVDHVFLFLSPRQQLECAFAGVVFGK